MKPSNIESVINYNQPPEDTKTILPLPYHQPVQSIFDPEFTPPLRQNPFLLNQWGGPAPERPLQAYGRRFSTLLAAPPPSNSPPAWGDSIRRSLCNSSWRGAAPGASKPPLPGLEESQSSSAWATGAVGTYSQFPQKPEPVFRPVSSYPPDVGCSLGITNCPSPEQKSDGNRYWPLMLSSLRRNADRNISKTAPAGHSRPMVCNFCKNNKEVPDIYLNHYLYDPDTKVLSCPVLRKHVCEICGKTGDQAHTLQYCPVNRERGLQAKVPVLLKTRTITNSTGKIRRN